MGVAVTEDGEVQVGVARAPADNVAHAPAPAVADAAVADTTPAATGSDGEVRTETTPA